MRTTREEHIVDLALAVAKADPEARALLGMIFLVEAGHADGLGGMEWKRREEQAGGWDGLLRRFSSAMERAGARLSEVWASLEREPEHKEVHDEQ